MANYRCIILSPLIKTRRIVPVRKAVKNDIFVSTNRTSSVRKAVILPVIPMSRPARNINVTISKFIPSKENIIPRKIALLTNTTTIRSIREFNVVKNITCIGTTRVSINKIGVLAQQFSTSIRGNIPRKISIISGVVSSRQGNMVTVKPSKVPRSFPLESRWKNN